MANNNNNKNQEATVSFDPWADHTDEGALAQAIPSVRGQRSTRRLEECVGGRTTEVRWLLSSVIPKSTTGEGQPAAATR